MSVAPHTPVPFRALLLRQWGVFGLVFLGSLVAFVRGAEAITARFAALAAGPYLMTSVVTQLRMLPAYLVLGLVFAWLARAWVKPGPRLFLRVLLFDVIAFLCVIGPALVISPGYFDAFARKLSGLNLFALQRLGVLHLLGVGALVLFARATWHSLPTARWRIGFAVISLLCVAGCWIEPAPPKATPLGKKNVLIIAADSWRFDRLGVHGATRNDLTPQLDAFAKQSIDFTGHHVSTASTLESWVTFFTGLFPPRHGIRSMYPSKDEVRAVEGRATLPKLLRANGYSTFVSSDWAGNCFDLVDLGFEHTRVSPVQNFEALLQEASVRAHPLVPLFFARLPGFAGEALVPGRESLASTGRPAVLVEQLFDDIDQSVKDKRPFLGLLFVSPTHLPYNARSPFNAKYVDPNYVGVNRYHVEIDAHQLITTGFAPTLPPAAIQHVRDLYDGAVSDFDDTVGVVLKSLEARGLLDETIVIITSDHGEDLYEPGSTVGHGTNFFGGDQSTRVPLLMRVPGVAPKTISAMTRTADLTPTVLSLLAERVPEGLDGVPLNPLVDGSASDLDLMVFAETCYLFFPKANAMIGLSEAERAQVVDLAGAADTLEVDSTFRHNLVLRPELRQRVIDAKDRMVRTAKWKLIEIPGKERPIRRLFDVTRDPLQQQNLAGQGLAIEDELSAALHDWSTQR
ncbi:MAG: sulfatase-like hydrolase/transferase [Archangium sp.]|nr:sulfatase-like hydrolase/transferase [Archangium sp.]